MSLRSKANIIFKSISFIQSKVLDETFKLSTPEDLQVATNKTAKFFYTMRDRGF